MRRMRGLLVEEGVYRLLKPLRKLHCQPQYRRIDKLSIIWRRCSCDANHHRRL